MSQRRVLKLSLACLLALAAVSFNSQGVRSQTLSPAAAAPTAPAGDGASAFGPARPKLADALVASGGEAASKGVARTGFYASSRLLDEGGRRAPGAVEGADARAAAEAMLHVDAGQGGAQQPHTPARTFTPLTPDGKMRRAFRRAFLSPEGYIRVAVAATLTEWGEEDLPHKTTEDRLADGLSRFAIKFSTRATRTMLGSGVYPVLFKQDPRYERSRSKNVGRRALHAMSRVFVTRGDNGRLQPNYSRWAGSLSAIALSNLWEQSTPGHDRIGVDATFRRFGTSFITDAWQTAVLGEFLPDIIKIFKR